MPDIKSTTFNTISNNNNNSYNITNSKYMCVFFDIYNIRKDLQKLANLDKAKVLQRFFKTNPGQYGEGDVFQGITVPELRKVAKKYSNEDIPLQNVRILLCSPIHEERFLALLILIEMFRCAGNKEKINNITTFYLNNLRWVNNWDLVDLSAPSILGPYLMQKGHDKSILYKLARSANVWERRIAIVATLCFIRNNQFDDTLRIAEILLFDDHDLIHKATGWMLREVGKRDIAAEEIFLKKHYQVMPRTMLRYAIERLPKNKRQMYYYMSKRSSSRPHQITT
jgi:3-methyladenine DNA glycosylase AlkD